jgi:hypothetical protein
MSGMIVVCIAIIFIVAVILLPSILVLIFSVEECNKCSRCGGEMKFISSETRENCWNYSEDRSWDETTSVYECTKCGDIQSKFVRMWG